MRWLADDPADQEHFYPVLRAREELVGYDESDVRSLRAVLQWIFERWRDEHGVIPPSGRRVPMGLLSNRPRGLLESGNEDGQSLTDWHPYMCTAQPEDGYVGLLYSLVQARYAPLVELSELVPWNAALAAMLLAEAFDYPSGGVGFADALLIRGRQSNSEWHAVLERSRANRFEAVAAFGAQFRRGNPKRRGQTSGLKKAIDMACAQVGTDYDAVLRFFADIRNTDDLYAAGYTEFKFQGIENGCIAFVRQRDLANPPDEFETIKPDTLKKYLRAFKGSAARDR
jgi:hypothetical protein